MNKKDYTQIFKSFKDLKVMIIGDVMLDTYLKGSVSRISPEAPIPIVEINQKESRLGGAANVAMNIKGLGAIPILCSVVGQDEPGHHILDIMHEEKLGTEGIVSSIHRPSTVKTRIISNNQQLIRYDEEVKYNLHELIEQEFLGQILLLIKSFKPDAVIFQDYDKGTITPVIIEEVSCVCKENKIPVLVDPKKKNFHHYRNISLFKPNLKELQEGLNITLDLSKPEEIHNECIQFMSKQNIKQMMITLSSDGIFACNKDKFYIIPAQKRDISDVSGAGDTVISVSALGEALNLELSDTAFISNLAGGLVCEKPGVIAIEKEQLLKHL